jgi:hypothetical protein
VEPGLLLSAGSRGARLAYIVLTRAVQELTIVTSGPTGPWSTPRS